MRLTPLAPPLARRRTAALALAGALVTTGCAGVSLPQPAREDCVTSFVYAPDESADAPRMIAMRTCPGRDPEPVAAAEALGEGATGGISAAAAATAVRDPDTGAIRIDDYPTPADAVAAGDMAAFMLFARATLEQNPRGPAAVLVAIDELADGDAAGARAVAEAAAPPPGVGREGGDSTLVSLLKPWLLALEGDSRAAVWALEDDPRLRGAPTAAALDRALLFEAVGRDEDAAEAYAAFAPILDPDMTPEQRLSAGPIAVASSEVRGRLALWAARAQHRADRRGPAGAFYELASDLLSDPSAAEIDAARLRAGEPPVDEGFSPEAAFARSLLVKTDLAASARDLQNLFRGDTDAIGAFSAQAASMRQAALLLDPGAPDLLRAAAVDLLAAGAFEGAARIAERGEGGEAGASFALLAGEARLNQKRDAEARDAAERAASAAPDDYRIQRGAAMILALLGDDPAAQERLDAADRAVAGEDDAARADVERARASTARQAGRFDEAVAAARRAVELDPEDNRLQLLGALLVESGDGLEEGLAILREQLAEEPDDPSRQNALGYSLLSDPDGLEEAFQLIAKAVRRAPSSEAIVDSLGWAYYMHGDFETARRYLQRAASLSEPFPDWEILEHLGDVYWRLDRPREAREAWGEAREARPPADVALRIDAKLADGLVEPAPESRPVPDIPPPEAQRERDA